MLQCSQPVNKSFLLESFFFSYQVAAAQHTAAGHSRRYKRRCFSLSILEPLVYSSERNKSRVPTALLLSARCS